MDRLIDDRRTRIIVCCGSGGVGKTTAAAAIGLRAAERGRQACVLTVDPARRLAQSMGLTSLDNTPRQVDGVETVDGGSLHAMMLDMKRTFDEIVEAHADPDRAALLMDEWHDLPLNKFPLELVACPDRRIARAALEIVAEEVADGRTEVTVLLPRREYKEFWHRFLHDRTSDSIAKALAVLPHANVTFVPYHLAATHEAEADLGLVQS
jgi:hypothetical protein